MNTQVLLGTMLGDSGIYEGRGFYTLSCEHSLAQEEYMKWKAKKLNIDNFYYRSRLDKRTNKIYSSCSYHKGSKDLSYYHSIFYKDGKKVITEEILDSLDKQAIAVWYCDDGSLYTNKIYHLSLYVDCFTDEERKLVVNYFKTKWNINFKISRKALRVTSKRECIKFLDTFGDFIPEEMNYKTFKEKI